MADDSDQTDIPGTEKEKGPTFPPPQTEVEHLSAAYRVLSSNLEKKAEGLEKVHQTKAAKAVRADIGTIDEIIPRVLKDQGIAGLDEKQRDLGRTALGLYSTNLKAAAGTNRGISREDWAEKCAETAGLVDTIIAPMLDEQPDIKPATEAAPA